MQEGWSNVDLPLEAVGGVTAGPGYRFPKSREERETADGAQPTQSRLFLS